MRLIGIAVHEHRIHLLSRLEAADRSARSSDHAALMVAATSASSKVMSIAKHASAIANGIDGEKPPPGLTSVASATGTPASINVARRRKSAELQVKGSNRQQRRRHSRIGHGRDRPLRGQRSGDRRNARRTRGGHREPPLGPSSSA